MADFKAGRLMAGAALCMGCALAHAGGVAEMASQAPSVAPSVAAMSTAFEGAAPSIARASVYLKAEAAALGEEAYGRLEMDRLKSDAIEARIAGDDALRAMSGRDDLASPTSMAGIARVDVEKFNGAPAWPPSVEESGHQASLLIGGVRGTWHAIEAWVPDAAARSNGRVYAYEGLAGPGKSPHNVDYVADNVKAIADGLVALRDGVDGAPAKSILIQTYSFGGVVAQEVVQELGRRVDAGGRSELSKFDKIDVVAMQPPDCAYKAADAIGKLPGFIVDWLVAPATKKFGAAMSAQMGTDSALYKSISNPHPDNVDITTVRAVGDEVTMPRDEASAERKAKVVARADHVATVLGVHGAPVSPEFYAKQGLASPYGKTTMSTEWAVGALRHAESVGYKAERSFPGALASANRAPIESVGVASSGGAEPLQKAALSASAEEGLAGLGAKLRAKKALEFENPSAKPGLRSPM